MLSRDDCQKMDALDPLAALRNDFVLPDGLIYLDGNSLGPRPRAALARATQVVDQEWGRGLVSSWNDAGWHRLSTHLGDKIAPLIGAGAGEVVVTDTTSINLFKVLAAALQLQTERGSNARVILSETSNFPSDLYMAEGLSDLLDRGYTLKLVDHPDEIANAVTTDVAVVMITQVNYKSGYMHDIAALTKLAHDNGALTIWDLAHSAGAVPVDLKGAQADFAIGCTYKYLNGGPGAPAFVWVSPQLLPLVRQPLTGWWSHAKPFAMKPGYEASRGIEQFLCGTQPIVSLSLVECGLESFAKTSMNALREKSLALTDLFIACAQERCAHHPVKLVTPLNHKHRGSHVSFEHENGYEVIRALADRGVIGDYREPKIMRFGLTPLYTTFTEVWDAVDILTDILDRESWRDARYAERNAVT